MTFESNLSCGHKNNDRNSLTDSKVTETNHTMLKAIVNKYLKAALDELFIDGGNVSMSMGSDLFSDSSINLSSLTFRSDLFDIYLQPLRLISGSIGKLSIEGLAELALSMGKVRCQVDQVFLLFEADDNLDAERVQIMKKLLLELQGNVNCLAIHFLLLTPTNPCSKTPTY